MNVSEEIESFAAEDDKPVLRWLFSRYHTASQWDFVAELNWHRYGPMSYEVNRVWSPTLEGRTLYAALRE